ncbi:glycine/D-amino acid oxidase-like deaminating enzyme [Gibbsiella quercinecans]|uniref:FAD-dependent oxidoreductase n=1 Tax=Gibbsiella quercinecans TaxID=929813 RepID=A0A250AX51_9GAMM|nr:FAD-binding oxidoreductase [Gibbsiella quercinecans]ATA18553.1 FAD-dependent oxidoreductase [Gibbsiella quercinecans]RLM04327.1 FAD-dependent oxidoreductase [Gibbsiella quercinecans]RLM07233.1 FAD-dependent oxidoreductase [Gibbsiella quercinecans]TCT82389.1 glycine/D-amino acid oxidase-like deaminating enzyme [Gibbsiella quercinecans]
MKLASFWQATAPAFSGATQGELPATADVVVIGGGFTGISAALSLARSGLDVVVLEAAEVMSQASGRNGGHCNTGVAQNFSALAASQGVEQATRYYQAYAGAVDYVQQLVAEEQIDCDFRRCGKLKLASKASHMPALKAAYDMMRRHVDPDVTLLSADEVRGEIDSPAFHGGLLQQHGGQMHMGKFGVGLADAAARAGARIYPHTAVTGLTRLNGYRHRISTARGDILADKVLMATGCSNVGPFAWFQRRIIPVGSFVIVTEPLAAGQLEHLLPGDRTYVTSLNLGNYFRTTADRRLVFGGRARFAISNPTSDARSGEVLRAGLANMFPTLGNVGIDYCWGGLVDMTADRLPHAGEHEGVFYSLGYSGHGTQMSVWMGRVMADLLAEKANENPWQHSDWPAVPGYFGKPWFLPMAGLYYKAKDRLS